MINEILIFSIAPLLFMGGVGYQTTFCEIEVDGNVISCDNMKDRLTIVAGDNILLTVNNSTDTLIINSTIPQPTISSLGGVNAVSCNPGDFMIGISSSGGIICQTP